ncbi:MAG: amidohydrolase family protein, partial [Bacteroidota bacterium]
GLVASVAEAIEIGEKAGVPVQVSHLKALGTSVWGLSDEVCQLIEEAQARGVNVMADQYPYPASSTGLPAAVVPRWVQEGGKMKERLNDPDLIEQIKVEVAENIKRRGGGESIVIASSSVNTEYNGLTITEISNKLGKSEVETAIELVSEDKGGWPKIVSFNMKKEDVEYIMKKEYVMTSSDGSVQTMGRGVPHPRSYGTYPHKLRKYVLEDSLVTMEHAIRAATYLPAQMLGLSDRGQIKEGFVADLMIFDPKTIQDESTFSDPHHYSKGIKYLLINGEIVIEDDSYNDKKVGKTLRIKNGMSSFE